MDFATILSRVNKYKTNEDASPLSAQLQILISKHGLEVFKDLDLLTIEIDNLELSKTIKAQLVLVFSSSTLPNYILNSKSDLNLIDVNNAIHNVVYTTGLSHRVALALITDVFSACGLNFAIEYGPQLMNGSIEYKLHALMPSTMVKSGVRNTERLIEAYNRLANEGKNTDSEAIQKAAGDAVKSIRKLCEAGVPEGFYLLGRCYLYGECGTEPDPKKALELMGLAAEHGIVEAAASLGDVYYEPIRDYTLAHHYYTRPGAMAMGTQRQRALQDIYKQHSANRTTLVFSGIVLMLMIAFLVHFHHGIFTEASRLAVGILFTVLSGLVFAASIWFMIRKPYNGLRWAVAVQYFVWVLYVFILVLA